MAEYKVQDSVAIIQVSNPPVNALSLATRQGIFDGVRKAASDPAVTSVVLCARGRTFVSGADIAEFATGEFMTSPSIRAVCDAVEASGKPVVAALHGTVLGGGFELAISAHYRVAHQRTSFGFPEVTLGILPAASGTQRFPRLCGIKAALDYMPTGKRFGLKEAQRIGAVDQVVKGDLLAGAVKFAKSVADKPVTSRRTTQMKVKDAHLAPQLMEAAVMTAKKRNKGMLAPIMNIQAVMASIKLPYEQGLERETQLATVLFTSGQARALQYAFFVERSAPKWRLPGGASFKEHKGHKIKSGAVIGAGTMGTGITMAMLNSGMPVVLVEQNQQFLDKGVAALKELYAGSVQRGLLSQAQMDMVLSQLKATVSMQDVAHVDLVIEAVYENLDLKKEIFKKLDSICKPDAILATNTSYLSVDKIAAVTSRPDKVIGTHFFVPAYYMRLLENIFHPRVSPTTVATAMTFGKQIGKVPVLVGTCDGFVGNRMFSKYGIEAGFLLEEGCLPQQVDRVMEEFGFAMGIFRVNDLSGLDIGWRGRKGRAAAQGRELEQVRYVQGMRTSYLADLLCDAGRFGRKTGHGWYKYARPGAKEAFPEPWVEQTIREYSRREGIRRRAITDQEVQERCIYSMINEGFKILEEGVASKPQDIDTIWLLGYGFPRYRGGPMYYAGEVGLQRVYDRVCHYYRADPCSPHWVPSPLLERLAEYNVPMQGWMEHVRLDSSKL